MTAQPSAEFRGHHDIDAPRIDARVFHPAWRVHTRLDGLLRDGKISIMAHEAGKRWRRDWEMALERSPGSRFDTVGRGDGHGDGPIVRIAALGRLRAAGEVVGEVLGLRGQMLLVCAVAHDLPWTESGRRVRCRDITARRVVARALEALVPHYEAADAAAAKKQAEEEAKKRAADP